MAKAELLQPFILKWEGGFADDPLDKGGATNKGITIATFRQFYGKDATVDQLKRITDEQWLHIFKAGYWDRWKADRIANQSVANILVDWLWASGVHGIKIPQRILGVAEDGIVGEKTLAALNAQNPAEFFDKIHAERIKFVEDIVRRNPTQARFIKGWKNRINDIKFTM
ncbi:glycoside hydrolase family 108 protein [Bacteroides sp.]|uniref:glycoside hydrolase family 108 protein n=1 Tax=Bacteroides sp. TaxID=29523 RepID=UPI002A81844F|nr:glycosyl hydrolase 108 family protein [Bacteroides sp.]